MIIRPPAEYRFLVAFSFPRDLKADAERIKTSVMSRLDSGSLHGHLDAHNLLDFKSSELIFLETKIHTETEQSLLERIVSDSIVIVALLKAPYWLSPNCHKEWSECMRNWSKISDRWIAIRYDDLGAINPPSCLLSHNVSGVGPSVEEAFMTESDVEEICNTILDVLGNQLDLWSPNRGSVLYAYAGGKRPEWAKELNPSTEEIPTMESLRDRIKSFHGITFVFLERADQLGYAEKVHLEELARDHISGGEIIVMFDEPGRRDSRSILEVFGCSKKGRVQLLDRQALGADVAKDYVLTSEAHCSRPRLNVFYTHSNQVVSGLRRTTSNVYPAVHWYDVERSIKEVPSLISTALNNTRRYSVKNLFIVDKTFIELIDGSPLLGQLPGLIQRDTAHESLCELAVCDWDLLRSQRALLKEYMDNCVLLPGQLTSETLANRMTEFSRMYPELQQVVSA